MKTRLDFLDGLRGLAILLVLGFHAYSRWAEILPYFNTFKDFPIFNLGWLGVQLFFLLSGFVIFMTLDRTSDFKNFMFKRVMRLFPAMLIICLFILITLPIFTARPTGNPDLLSLLPSLTFTEPSWWSAILGTEIRSLEGAFWSLYVEFKFYIVAGSIYYIVGRKYFIPCLMLLFLSTAILMMIPEESHFFATNIALKISNLLSFEHFGWFCSGACFYVFFRTKVELYFFFGLAIAAISSYLISENSGILFIAAMLLSLLFAFSLRLTMIQIILRNKVFLFFGFISYPLYLLHENTMISIIIQTQDYLSWMNPFFYPFLAIAPLTLISYLVAKKGEPWLKQKLVSSINNLSSNKFKMKKNNTNLSKPSNITNT